MKIKRRLLATEISNAINKQVEKSISTRFTQVLSTGSTLLDLTISGGKVVGGGIPGGIILEIFGQPGSGKTALLTNICSNAQIKGGDVRLADPEGRLDEEYSSIYGLSLKGKYENCYYRPDTVTEMFDDLKKWNPQPNKEKAICVFGADSLAALSTQMELEAKDGDKRGQRRAKEFSEGLRKYCRKIARDNLLVACTNQTRVGDMGEDVTPGGKGIPFYASLRIKLSSLFQNSKIEKEIDYEGRKIKKVVGITSSCKVVKSTVDDPFRSCNLSIVFNYGIDDIRDELQFIKDMKKLSRYNAVNKEFHSLERAIQYVEENNLQNELRNYTIDLWLDIEDKFKIARKQKVVF